MSQYINIDFVFSNEKDLLKALDACGYKPTVHDEAVSLEDWKGRKRENTKAHIIIPRKQLNRLSNDMGFERMPDGTLRPHVSDYDSPPKSMAFPKIKQEAIVAASEREARRRGLRVKRHTENDGTIKLRVSGFR